AADRSGADAVADTHRKDDDERLWRNDGITENGEPHESEHACQLSEPVNRSICQTLEQRHGCHSSFRAAAPPDGCFLLEGWAEPWHPALAQLTLFERSSASRDRWSARFCQLCTVPV